MAATCAPAFSADAARKLKQSLKDRLTKVSSSHLSEAIASALGFQSNIALNKAITDDVAPSLDLLQDQPFFARLEALGYQDIPLFHLVDIIVREDNKAEFLNVLERIRVLEIDDVKNYDQINLLRRRAVALFAKMHGLGYPGSAYTTDLPTEISMRFMHGIDHAAAAEGWGDLVNTRHPQLEFPKTDHRYRFYQRLPLANGKFIEYSFALVSMPYRDSFRHNEPGPSGQEYAREVGWKYSEHDESGWYAVGKTNLQLFQRTTPHHETLRMWNTSFKKWLLDNKTRLLKSARGDKRLVIKDAIDCPHLPLHVQTWEELRESYFKEFSPKLYYPWDDSMAKAFQRLFQQWRDEQSTVS
ncbi:MULTISPECIES: hypothetical protein [unclassified Herbaspirillum]|uniref:hypothetical protein n=1 Tax=unclassified Herbaspirillum TaxID=2624150 RepID=UPI001154E38A|nr:MULTISPECIES: hypothetical protein [unclassified Herbaspirillum]MBB5392220.1 hypothetical protein [Herbaspirillum sp. SJZ102]TQK13677.1 hypothetical protein FB599_1097 [Herbaspirillum sp. SJZ130]TQK15680.1 hypothetical protein FB598_1034 [Herbaspirillum sp. SJZ106]TWC71579.1 hypothetical protein FB597_101554 [Herbaspirillum sp. SJZ099]